MIESKGVVKSGGQIKDEAREDKEEIDDNNQLKHNKMKYARKCSATGEGMNEGYVFRDGDKYFKYEKDLVAHLRSLNVDERNELTDEYLIDESYNLGEHYWTEWEDEDDFEYEMVDGIIEL